MVKKIVERDYIPPWTQTQLRDYNSRAIARHNNLRARHDACPLSYNQKVFYSA